MKLKQGQIAVWFTCVDRSRPEIKEFEAVLSPQETARARRFHSLRDRDRYIVQHGVLRSLLAGYLGCEPLQVEIRTKANGKPFLAGPENEDAIQFSMSHSDAFAMCAFSLIDGMGVDIEKIREFPDMLGVVEQYFTQHEKYRFFCCRGDQRLLLFYRFWTRKEAVLKAQGDGLLRDLDSVDVAAGEGHGPWSVRVAGDPVTEEYSVMDIEGPASFATAVAIADPFDNISISVNSI